MPYKDKQSKVGPFRKMLFGPKGKIEMRGRPMPNVGDTLKTPQGTPIRVQRIQNGEYVGNNGKTYIPQIDLPRVTVVQKRHYPAEHLDEGFARLLAAGVAIPSSVGLMATGSGELAGLLLSQYPELEFMLGARDIGKAGGGRGKTLEERRKQFINSTKKHYRMLGKNGGPRYTEKELDSLAQKAINEFSNAHGYYW